MFLAGADLPSEVDLLTRTHRRRGLGRHGHRGDNDTVALLRAGTDAADAVAVVCGAGINCVGRSADGRTARFPSLGSLSGDWGGGRDLAKLALWNAVRGEDGRGPATALSTAIADHFGLSTSDEVGIALHLGAGQVGGVRFVGGPGGGHLDRARLSELTPVLFAVAAAGDPVAAELVQRQVTEIVSMATIIARRLDLLDSPFTVVLGGGVLRARHPQLITPVTDGILAAAPKATVTIVDAPPVLGAALSALDALGASPDAHHTLRTAPFPT